MVDGQSPSKGFSVGTAASAGASTAIAMFNPALGIAAAFGAPYIANQIDAFVGWFRNRQDVKADVLLGWVAKIAGIDVAEILKRCNENPDLEDLLLRTLRATSDTSIRAKIISYATALASGMAEDQSEADINWERMFVRTLDDLDFDHLRLLEVLSKPHIPAGLYENVEGAPLRVGPVDERLVSELATDLENLPMLLATLQRNGLVQFRTSHTSTWGGGITKSTWELTEYGLKFLARLIDIENLVATQESEDA